MPGSVIVSFARTPIAKFRSTLQALGQCPLPVAQLQFNGDEKMDRVFVAHDCGPACAVTIDPSSLLQSGQHAAAQNGAAEAGGGTEASDSHLRVVGEGECRADATEVVGHCQPMPTAAASFSRVESDECDVGDAIGGRHFGKTANRRASESPGVSPEMRRHLGFGSERQLGHGGPVTASPGSPHNALLFTTVMTIHHLTEQSLPLFADADRTVNQLEADYAAASVLVAVRSGAIASLVGFATTEP